MRAHWILGGLLWCASPLLLAQEAPQASPQAIARFLRSTRHPDATAVADLQKQLESAKATLREISAGRIVPELKETSATTNRFGRVQYQFPTAQEKHRLLTDTQQKIGDLQSQLESIRSGRGIAPQLQLANLQLGALGTLPDRNVQVIKIIDGNNWIGKLRRPVLEAPSVQPHHESPQAHRPAAESSAVSTPYVWFANMPTAGLREKSSVTCPQAFYVSGKQKCSPIPGPSQMVFVLTAAIAQLPEEGDRLFGDTLPPMPEQ